MLEDIVKKLSQLQTKQNLEDHVLKITNEILMVIVSKNIPKTDFANVLEEANSVVLERGKGKMPDEAFEFCETVITISAEMLKDTLEEQADEYASEDKETTETTTDSTNNKS